MNRSRGARYLPLLAVVAIQLLVVAVAPSKMQTQNVAAGGTAADQGVGGIPGLVGGAPTGGGDTTSGGGGTTTDTIVTTSGGGTTSSGGGGTSSGGGGGGTGDGTAGGSGSGAGGDGGGSGGGQAAGDTSHCTGDRQFDPAIDFYAPPCVPKQPGTNNGASYRGVTDSEIKIVQYVGAGDPAVNAILEAQGALVNNEQYRAYGEVAAAWANDNYEFYGRQITFETFQGTCDTIPPDIECLRGEFQRLVDERNPFVVFWNSSVCSQCFEELSKLQVVNLGGWNFRDDFGARWRPYHYDTTMSGTRLAQHAARMWCRQLAGRNAVESRSYSDTTRQLGVISQNDPQNQSAVEVDLVGALKECDASYGNRKYFYAQDISTADQQRRAGVLAMRGNAVDPNDDATSVMCFCDLVAPAFLYQEEDTQQYYPENIVVGSGFMDYDEASQAYIGTVGCPQRANCAFDNAFGFRSINPEEPEFTGVGHRIWELGGGQGQTPFESADQIWDYHNLIYSSIHMAGPDLTPAAFEQGAFRLGARGDATHAVRQISPGNYQWGQDVLRSYWDSSKQSDYNGNNGTWIALDNKRTSVDGWANSPMVIPAR